MSIDDDAWGWNLGALFTLSPTTKVGVSYRSAIQYHTDGKVKLSGDGTPAGNATANALGHAGGQSDVKADLKVPDTFILSVTQKLSDRWEMLGDVSWTGWSSIKNVNIMRTSGPLAGRPRRPRGRFPGYLPRRPGRQLSLYGCAEVHVRSGLRSDPGQEGVYPSDFLAG
jgi:hypothetical protein